MLFIYLAVVATEIVVDEAHVVVRHMQIEG
jgi:hypothetical protein